ncbi:DUF6193 family natural product biosynthesis protein [Streptomyces sp. AP-93]|uniref:DUF6193 family natural product biosynthesis protein n=1 Tax=Streptomyces sp. AP-93 TaxID=2929048 RepID=UPI001FAFF510|nr:DUF6193 family natural product biosynthesis protein [Streptomyces sp. AP-93]MCJ0870001.1 DUF6193 family natural product biosynthesis protein [Streptomyces sp. AP-93]
MNVNEETRAAVVEAQWLGARRAWADRLERLEHLGPKVWHLGTIAVLDAAHEDPVLRQLYPYTSHCHVHFSSTTRFPYEVAVPFVIPLPDGRFRVVRRDPAGEVGEVATAGEAVDLVVAHVPPGLRLATTGLPMEG